MHVLDPPFANRDVGTWIPTYVVSGLHRRLLVSVTLRPKGTVWDVNGLEVPATAEGPGAGFYQGPLAPGEVIVTTVGAYDEVADAFQAAEDFARAWLAKDVKQEVGT